MLIRLFLLFFYLPILTFADNSAEDSEGSHRSPSPPKGRRNNRRNNATLLSNSILNRSLILPLTTSKISKLGSHSRQNSTYSRRIRSESPTKSRNGSADSNKSKSSYIRSESPRYCFKKISTIYFFKFPFFKVWKRLGFWWRSRFGKVYKINKVQESINEI